MFAAVSDGIVEMWLSEMHSDVRSLQPFYNEGSSRLDSYRSMVDAMLAEVRLGRKVCGAFYGHAGVFAWAPHKAIEIAHREGYAAHMEPGISAEDCLYADLGLDPGRYGCQHFEASQILLYERRIDLSAYVVLWQVGVVGDESLTRFATGPEYRKVLVDFLIGQGYPRDHEIVIYRAPTLPIEAPKIERIPLSALAEVSFNPQSTVVLPPAHSLKPNAAIRAQLAALSGEVRL